MSMIRRDFLKSLPVALLGTRLLPARAASTGIYRLYFGNRGGAPPQSVAASAVPAATGAGIFPSSPVPREKAIYTCTFNSRTGKYGKVIKATNLDTADWLALSPDEKHLYAAGQSESVSSFRINKETGELAKMNSVYSDAGGGTTYVGVNKTGTVAVAANMSAGSTTSFRILPGGQLSERISCMQHVFTEEGPNHRQKGPHAHSSVVSPDNRFVLSPDLGGDKICVFRLDASRAELAVNDPPYTQLPAGSGPRHLAFHPNGKRVYLITEFTARIVTFSWDAAGGVLQELQAVEAYPNSQEADSSGSEVQVDCAGRFVYASVRSNHTLAVFAIDPTKGTLAPVQYLPSGGKNPWSFRLDPTGRFLLAANQGSNQVTIFSVDSRTGKLTPTGESIEVSRPSSVVFVAV